VLSVRRAASAPSILAGKLSPAMEEALDDVAAMGLKRSTNLSVGMEGAHVRLVETRFGEQVEGGLHLLLACIPFLGLSGFPFLAALAK
jgi:hypothetical protein